MNLNKSILALSIIINLVFTGCESEEDLYINNPGNLVPKTADEDPSIPSISVNGTTFHSETYGKPDGPMIVVLHGGPGADYRYLLNVKAFAENGYYVVFYDQRGSGLSKRHSQKSYSIQLMIDDLDAVIAHYRASPDQKIFLLGHSWGGMLATAYINDNPATIHGAILAEPGGFTWDQTMEYMNRSFPKNLFSETLNDAVYFDQFITGKEDEHAVLDYKFMLMAAADEAENNKVGNKGPLSFWRTGAVVQTALFEIADKTGFDWTTNLHRYENPVLFVYSERSEAYGLSHAQKVSAPYPNVELFLAREAGHDMISFPDAWKNFYPAALTYLNGLK